MNCKLIEEIYCLDIPVKKRAVLLAMATLSNDEGKVCAPMAYIGWKSDYSEAQARRYVKALVRDKLLNPIKLSSGRMPSTYQIQPSQGVQKQPYQGALPTLATLTYDDKVDYTQPLHIDDTVASDDRVSQPLHIGDRVSDSQPSTIEQGDDRVNGVGKIPLKKPPKETSKPELQSIAKRLLESWNMAHPDNRKPKKVYSWHNIGLANQLNAEGFTIEDVHKLTTEKINNRTGDYPFDWLVQDLRDQRKVRQATSHQNGASTPEEIAERFASKSEPEKPENHEWSVAYDQLKVQLDVNAFERFRNAKPIGWEGDTLIVSVPSEYDQRECQTRLYRSIKRIVSDSMGKPVELTFKVGTSTDESDGLESVPGESAA
jgi:hypothetical protein